MIPTRVTKALLLAVIVLLLWWTDPIAGRSSLPWSVFLWVAFLTFCLVVPLYAFVTAKWLPAKKSTLLLMPLYFLGLSATTYHWKAPKEPPPNWTADRSAKMAILARLTIVKEIRPGLVLADTEWVSTEHFTGRWVWTKLPGQKKRQRIKIANYVEPVNSAVFPVAVQGNKDEMPVQGCTLMVRLTPKYFAKELKGGYLESMRYHGASSYMRLKPWLITSQTCQPGKKAELKQALIQLVTRGRMNPFTDEEFRFSDESEGIALGMLTGKSGWMDRETKTMAAGLGILHLFAASGLHLGILYAVLYWPLSKLFGPRHGLATAPPLIIAFGYVWLLDFPVSLVRAFFFVSLFSLRSFVHRRITTTDHLLNTALLTAFFFPDSMISLSALLSFSAVGGILYLYDPIDRLFRNDKHTKKPVLPLRLVSAIGRFFRKQAQISFTASLPVTPWIIVFFKSYAFLSPIANMVIVPMAGVLLPLLFISIFTGVVIPGTLIDQLLWLSTIKGFDVLVWVMNLFDSPELFVKFSNVILMIALSFLILFLTVLALVLIAKKKIGRQMALSFILLFFGFTGPLGFWVYRLFTL